MSTKSFSWEVEDEREVEVEDESEVQGNMDPFCVLKWVPEDIAFPVGFAWGAATAAYQIQEGWNADGKGPNVWDTFTHQGGDGVFRNQTGDVACGSYTLWEEDLKCIKQLGLTHYRFSLSWSRLLPDGTTGFINQKGACEKVTAPALVPEFKGIL
ncbi:cytosolic beta-glucosidase-like [Indicator indicator]|uniref:cytosolic beta-glucosidase-like n=1 Tax=Indicator indicator TaxID=1002788 RepID=UPI0023DF4B72|nr:cytosolic beta-glucosidase-like [Indicator indicator]